jgi:hypothetical protein
MEAVDDRLPATTVDARVRADRVDVRVRNLTENREGQSGPLRVVGQSPEWRQVLRKAILPNVPLTDLRYPRGDHNWR